MADNQYIIFVFVCLTLNCLCCVLCELNLNEDEPCTTKGLNGTCVGIFRCTSASLTYLYANAGYDVKKYKLPELPDICSYKNNEPVVCCTDCKITQEESFREYAIGPYGDLSRNDGSVASRKCFEHFKRLPYPCRGGGNINVKKVLDEDLKCHQYGFGAALGVGGRDAQKWEFPHVALIGYGEDVESAQWLCGGSVISERFILTAGHCTSTHALGNISFAALGLLKRTDPKEYWKIHNIKRIILHPEYKPPSKYHDIALLETETDTEKLTGKILAPCLVDSEVPCLTDAVNAWKAACPDTDRPVNPSSQRQWDEPLCRINFGRDLLPACLDVGSNSKSTAEASGWGRLGHRQALADTLQVVYLEEYGETECSRIYQRHRHLKNGYDHEKQMCFGSHSEIIDTCEGDSGGPLQTNKLKCQYTIVGVTSYGKDCGILGSAGIYTRVSHYVPWIESVVWPEETEARRKKY